MRVAADSTNVSVILRIVDSADGTPETGVTSATSGIALGYWRENAAAFTGLTESNLATLDAAHSDGGLLHINGGYYRVDVPDAAFATGVDQVLIGGTITDMVVVGVVVEIGATLDTVKSDTAAILADTGTDGVVVASIAAGAITAAAIATGAIDADAIADNAIDAGAIASDAITAAKIATGAITSAKFAAGAIDAAAIATDAIDADALAADAIAEINATVDTAISDAALATAANLATVDTVVDTILVDTNELQTDLTNGGRLDLILDATLADTNELQADWANGGRLDLLIDALATAAALTTVDTVVDAIKVVTDALTSAAATKLALSAGTIVVGNAITGTLSTTAMTTDLTEATDDHYNGRIIIWTSGVLTGQATDITDYTGSTKTLTYTAITEAPSNGDDFVII